MGRVGVGTGAGAGGGVGDRSVLATESGDALPYGGSEERRPRGIGEAAEDPSSDSSSSSSSSSSPSSRSSRSSCCGGSLDARRRLRDPARFRLLGALDGPPLTRVLVGAATTDGGGSSSAAAAAALNAAFDAANCNTSASDGSFTEAPAFRCTLGS